MVLLTDTYFALGQNGKLATTHDVSALRSNVTLTIHSYRPLSSYLEHHNTIQDMQEIKLSCLAETKSSVAAPTFGGALTAFRRCEQDRCAP